MDSQLTPKAGCELEVSLVDNEELLYRRIFSIVHSDVQHYKISSEGKINFSTMAFSDKSLSPSVDRACLHGSDAAKTQSTDSDGVIGLIAKNVRAIDDVSSDKDGVEVVYKIDVIHRPKLENKAHTQIEPSPQYASEKIFNKKVRQRLARLADQRLVSYGWEIEPSEIRRENKVPST